MDTGIQSAQLDIPLPALPGIERGWELLLLEENKRSGLFTAERMAKDEQRLDVVKRALAEGMSIRSIAASQGCSVNTVLAVKRRFGSEIETLKQELGRNAIDVAHLAMERMRDEMADMPKASLPIIFGVMVDKAQLLTGAPTMRIQHDHSEGVADIAAYIDALPSVTPVETGDGCLQKAPALIEVGVLEDIVDAAVVDQVVPGSGVDQGAQSDTRDSQSRVLNQSTEVKAATGTDVGQKSAETGGGK